ncbi:pseudaminic acid synthase [Halobacteriovorax marinus]|uniref:Pseudaminic acid synthase n=1 Tax=Halobacteriovorax marinus TaxID=97084 RepID=A0A1Y5FB60_9BACT|nr:pseudaminic acid synthase [Halobacteriovorax marinus]
MKNNTVSLGRVEIGINCKPFFIAEMSGNHNHSLEKALQIVDAAALAGANALKIQTYTPETMTLDISRDEFLITDPDSLWYGKNLYQLYGEAMTPWEWHAPIKKRCEEKGLIFFSTPFDSTSVDFLEELGVDFYKIASFENTDLPLIKKVAQTGKPMIISTGLSTITEISEAVSTARENGCKDLILLKCTSAYPASPKDANILSIPHLRETFSVESGLSDHSMGIGVALASIAHGATVIEKHFTLDRNEGGVDSAFSMEPSEFKMLVEEGVKAWESLGNICYSPSVKESKSKVFKRSLYICKDLKKGDVLSTENVRVIRPGYGLASKHFENILGRTVRENVSRGTALSFELLS